MEKLEREFLENGGEWKEVCVDELFNKKTMKGFPKYEENLSAKDEGFHIFGQNIRYQYPQKVILNNKYLHKIDKDKPILAYTSSSCEIGIIEESFYRSGDNGAFQGLFPKFKNYNKKHLLFILSMLKKHFNTFDYSTSMADFMKLEILLPFKNGKINFSYMEKFIEELEAERIEELEAYLVATGLKDYKLTKEDQKILDDFEKMSDNSLDGETDRRIDKIRLGNIFNIESPKKKFNANSIKFDGEYPYVARGETNNGIKGYITEEVDYLNNGNTISFGQDTATMFYQKTPYFTGDKIKILSPKLYSLDTDIALYYITATKKTLSTFSWGSTSYNVNNLENIIIELPIEDNKIDITFMKKFIKVVKKLIIKDVVIWADKKIEATKQVVFKH